jgi:8-hydroxy-5-deazaflavin:NADPH oxidoreductase
MRIGIIGAGQVGSSLAGKLSATGHRVFIANSRESDTIRAIAGEAGASAVTVAEVVKDVDIVIIAIPERNVRVLPKGLFDEVSPDVIVVDAGNYYPGMRGDEIVEIEGGMPESQWVSQQVGRPVVKAFNTILAYSLTTKGMPDGTAGRIALPVSGDDPGAKKIVIDLIDAIGFDGVDAGTIAESWRQQPGTPACCSDLQADGLRRALSMADKAQAGHLRDLILQKMSQLNEGFTIKDLIDINRAVHNL